MREQEVLFELCKERIGAKNLANELADLLGVNIDAAYRRMRGVTALTFDEIKKICLRFNISFDSVINYEGSLVPFQFNAMFQPKFRILDYLKNISVQLEALSKDPDGRFLLTAMDLPYFRQFGFSALSRFKLFFWQRSVLDLPEYRERKFNALNEEDKEYVRLTLSIFTNYHKVASSEIWTSETLDSAIVQISYYLESGMFQNKESAIQICDELDDLLKNVEKEAQLGKKILPTKDGVLTKSFEMYQSDVYLSNNLIQAYTGGKIFTYVSFNSFNSLMSFSPHFSAECHRWIDQIRSKSVLLSEVSERLRYQYFLGLRTKIDSLREKIKEYKG